MLGFLAKTNYASIQLTSSSKIISEIFYDSKIKNPHRKKEHRFKANEHGNIYKLVSP